MEVLSDTLTLKFESLGYRFTLKSVIMLAMNMVLIFNQVSVKQGLYTKDGKSSC